MPEQAALTSYVPLDVPVPPIPQAELFSELQWKTLLSLADTVIPSIRSSGDANSTKVVPESQFSATVSTLASNIRDPDSVQIATRYLEESASSNPAFRDAIQRLFGSFVHQEGRNGLSFILNALKYVPFLLTYISAMKPLTTVSILQHKGRLTAPYWIDHPHPGPAIGGPRACFC